MTTEPRLSHQTLRVLTQFLERPSENLSGADICKQTGLLSGTLYPILLRLERVGWLASKWEVIDTREAGRPKKRLYRLTAAGRSKSQQALATLYVPGSEAWI